MSRRPSLDLGSKADRNNADTSEAPNSKIEDPNGVLEPSAEAQIADSEQATYASANNDLKGTKSYQEADIPGLYNIAMAINDYRGHRLVAQVCLISYLFMAFVDTFAACIMIFCYSLYSNFFVSHLTSSVSYSCVVTRIIFVQFVDSLRKAIHNSETVIIQLHLYIQHISIFIPPHLFSF